MKNVIDWIKANLVIAIAVVVAVVSFPTLFVISSGKSTAIHTKVEQEVSGDLRDLKQINVNYTAPSLDPSAPSVSFSRVPDEPTTLAIERYLKSLNQEAKRLRAWALKLNHPQRRPLIQGLFPQPSEAQRQSKLLEMARVWPTAVVQLLHDAGGGAPPDPMGVQEQLTARQQIERQRALGLASAQAGELSPEQDEEIRSMLGAERLDLYRERADSLHFYASDSVFAGVGPWDETLGAPPIELEWDWQFRYWVYQSVIDALVRANTDQAGQVATVIDAPVKRIERIAVAPWALDSIASDAASKPPAKADLTGEIRRDYEVSPTGRSAWPESQNPLYDIRYVDLTLLVDSSRIVQVIDAFPAAGLMSVVDLSIEQYDPRPDLGQGFYYGPNNIVRANMRIETLWMRQWMAPMMPPSIRAALGVPDAWANPTSDAGAGSDTPGAG